jgi:HAD superfamily hydrolase (TIGR01484 family)
MRYLALATDYDGTIAHHGKVDTPTLAALERLLASGRRLILVTGRELDELLEIFPEVPMFSWVVAENGALLYRPDTRETRLLAHAPPPEFVRQLRDRGVAPMSVGRAIVATWHPHENTVLETIRDLGLEMQVIFNKDAVMVLPSGINKATGLKAALKEMGLTVHETVGVGDAENDHAFMSLCECAAAVANALPAVKERADVVTRGDHGAGVAELIDHLVENDLADLDGRLTRHHLELGADPAGRTLRLPPYGENLLIGGPSGSGKSTAAASILERLTVHGYRFCIIDPEGDYENFPGTVTLGNARRGPSPGEALQMLATERGSTVLNLVGLPVMDRPPFFLALLPQLLELRARTGRPHWLIVDEAHHLIPASWEPGKLVLPRDLTRAVFITVHAGQVAPVALAGVTSMIAVGPKPEDTIGEFCAAVHEPKPDMPSLAPDPGEVMFWPRRDGRPPTRLKMVPGQAERRRHSRKYAEGELPPDRSFYFRGPEGKLNLRAQNLLLFLQLADGVDDETWQFHLKQGDYSTWFRERIKDSVLADEAAAVEDQSGLTPQESRAKIKAAVERYYTLPASQPLPMPGTDAAPKHE